MAWDKLDIKQLKNRIIFLVFTIVSMSATVGLAVELNPVAIAQDGEKLGIVGILIVVIVIQAIGLLYLLRLLGTKIIQIIEKNSATTERVIEAIEYCKQVKTERR